MQDGRYVPPHMRSRGGSQPGPSSMRASARPPPGHSSAGPASSSSGSAGPSGMVGNYGAGIGSRGGWHGRRAGAVDSVLASPAADIRPATASKQARLAVDEMELVQSVSRSGGDGAQGDALKDWDLQERFRQYIDERLDKHYATFQTPRDQPPPEGSTEELESLSSIVLLFRKLREGVVASGLIDDFAIEVFESSAKLAVLAKHLPQLLSALSGLVPGLYLPVESSRKGKGKAATPSGDPGIASQLAAMSIQDAASEAAARDHRAEFARLLLLFQLVQNGPTAFHQTYLELTTSSPITLRSPLADISESSAQRPKSDPPPEPPFLTPEHLELPLRVCRILSPERFSPTTFFELLRNKRLTAYERAILAWASASTRQRAWEVMKKGYMEVSVPWAGRWLGLNETQVLDWATSRGCRVEQQRVKLR